MPTLPCSAQLAAQPATPSSPQPATSSPRRRPSPLSPPRPNSLRSPAQHPLTPPCSSPFARSPAVRSSPASAHASLRRPRRPLPLPQPVQRILPLTEWPRVSVTLSRIAHRPFSSPVSLTGWSHVSASFLPPSFLLPRKRTAPSAPRAPLPHYPVGHPASTGPLASLPSVSLLLEALPPEPAARKAVARSNLPA